jgi:hypothetical protein
MVLIKRIIKIILAMSGILIDKITALRITLLALIVAGYLLHHFLFNIFSTIHALIYFLFFFVTRYIFLFSSFSKHGVSQKLISKFGEKKGYDIYQFITALMFFFVAASYSLLVTKSAGYFILFIDESTLIGFGFIVFTIGMIVNVWSTLVVGIDIYYYKDLFLGRPTTEFKKKVPIFFFLIQCMV